MKVLVTTDGSARSLQVLPHAARLVRAADGELIVARVLDPRIDVEHEFALHVNEAVERVSGRWRDELAVLLESAGVRGRAGVFVRAHGDEVHDTLLRAIGEEAPDVLAMSSRGAGAVRHAVFGSVTMGVLARTAVPILVAGDHVVDPVDRGEYRIVVCWDGSDDSLRAVDRAIALAQQSMLRFTLLRINVPAYGDRGESVEAASAAEELEGMRARFPDPAAVACAVRTIPPLGGIDTAILEEAKQMGASAIAISTHGHSARYHLFAGSTALGVLAQSTIPVLLVRSSPS